MFLSQQLLKFEAAACSSNQSPYYKFRLHYSTFIYFVSRLLETFIDIWLYNNFQGRGDRVQGTIKIYLLRICGENTEAITNAGPEIDAGILLCFGQTKLRSFYSYKILYNGYTK
jgi:hypothetical protein